MELTISILNIYLSNAIDATQFRSKYIQIKIFSGYLIRDLRSLIIHRKGIFLFKIKKTKIIAHIKIVLFTQLDLDYVIFLENKNC